MTGTSRHHSASNTPVKEQPTPTSVAAAIAKTPGTVLTFRSFKSACVKSMRSVSNVEFNKALEDLKAVGEPTFVRAGPHSKSSLVFLKHDPEVIEWDKIDLVSKEEFRSAYIKKLLSSITTNMKNALVASGKGKEDIPKD